MKVIFLDIDGVLNSRRYDRERDPATQGNIDVTRLPLLKRLVEETGAVIVLSSSWRRHWDSDPAGRDDVGAELDRVFGDAGLSVFDKTPELGGDNRDGEILAWLDARGGEVERFVILDDIPFGWGDLADRLVRTNPLKGLGLMKEHIARAAELLR